MKVILYMAISVDGFIAKKDGDSEWVSDFDNFIKTVSKIGCISLGKKTFDQYQGELYPIKNVTNIVLTKNKKIKSKVDNVIYVNSPKEAIKKSRDKGYNQILIIGGGKTNVAFLKDGLIDEIYLSVHPLVLGKGIKIFEGGEVKVNLKLLGIKELKEDLVQLHYKVKGKI